MPAPVPSPEDLDYLDARYIVIPAAMWTAAILAALLTAAAQPAPPPSAGVVEEPSLVIGA